MKALQQLLSAARRHPQTGEYMLTYAEISVVLQHIAQTGCTVILGGDVLNAQGQHLRLNWYYQSDTALSPTQNARQSSHAALHYIQHLPDRPQLFYIPVFNSTFYMHQSNMEA